MIEKINNFWKKNKDTIKNVVIAVSVPTAIISLIGLNRMNKVVEENGLEDLFFGEEIKVEAE